MAAEGSILHADLDSFYASVEQRDDPTLRGRPVLVGGGVVLAASYEAKARGVRTPTNVRQARQLCPDAVVVPPRMFDYAAASRDVFAVFDDTSPIVEGISIDEAFLDVSGLRKIRGEPSAIAARLRADVLERVGLPITVGVARTKFLAKVASGVAKPDGLLVVPTDAELDFLHPLPVERLWGVGPKTAEKLHERRVRTVGDVAVLGERSLVSLLGGAAGRHLHAIATGHDPRRVVTGVRRSSVGAQHSLGRGPHTGTDVEAALDRLVDRVCGRLRKAERRGRTVVLRLRFDDFTKATRSHTLPGPTSQTRPVRDAARALLAEAEPEILERGITLVGVAVASLDDGPVQPELPLDGTVGEDGTELDAAIDAVRARFGHGSLTHAVQLGRDEGVAVPTLPD